MLNDLDLSTITLALYSDQPDGFWTHLFPNDAGYVGVKRTPDGDVVVWRGSTTENDWLANFAAEPENDGRIGWVHSGFMGGVEALYDKLDAVLSPRVYVVGHSRGAAQAGLFARLRKYYSKCPVRLCRFGSPRFGFVSESDVPGTSYKNRNDPVTLVPFTLAPKYDYRDFGPFTAVDVAPDFGDSWGLLADHHMRLYHTAMQGLFQPTL